MQEKQKGSSFCMYKKKKRKSMIVVNHVVKLIIKRRDVPSNVARAVRWLEERVVSLPILLHAHINTARLRMRLLREVHSHIHIPAVLLVSLLVSLGILGGLVVVLVRLLDMPMHGGVGVGVVVVVVVVVGGPHLEWSSRRELWFGRMHGEGRL